MKNRKRWQLSPTITYTLFGVLFGFLFPLAAVLFEVFLIRQRLTWETILDLHRTQPLIWLIDTAPLFLGLAFGLVGRRTTALMVFNDQLEETVAQRTEALRQANENLLKEIDERKRIEKSIYIFREVTGRKEAELELLRQKRYFEALVRNIPVAVVMLDTDGNIMDCNPAFERLFGYQREEVIGGNIDTFITTEETKEEAVRYTQKAMQRAVHEIGKRRRKDGSYVDVELFGVPVFVGAEKIGVLGIYHDISELVQARREAEEADKAKGEFLANMSHEIRTPMNGVIGMIELALDTELTAEQRDYLKTALDSAEALLSLLNDILDFSKIEARQMDLDHIEFNLRTTVENVCHALAERAYSKGLEMACLIDYDIPTLLKGDPGRLRQILANLVGNAIKFTDEGEVVVRASKVTESKEAVKIRFEVEDTGIGIPHDRQDAVFGRFTQADGSTTRRYGGTGLGLAISQQLVALMGGEIGLESDPGVGSKFWFTAVFGKQTDDEAVVLAAPKDLHGFRVLGVDDNATNRWILSRMLANFQCRVNVASSGPEAIEMLRSASQDGNPYQLVLLDMQMPQMDGEQTARAIKSDPAIRDVDIVILTSMGKRGDAARLEALGCAGYLLKPVKQEQLLDVLLAVVGQGHKPPVESSGRIITRHTLSELQCKNMRILLAEDNAGQNLTPSRKVRLSRTIPQVVICRSICGLRCRVL